MKKYFLIIDQGTTSCRSVIYDKEFNLIDKVSIKLTQSYPHKNWVEHDPIEIWNSQKSTMQQILIKNNISIEQIISIGITNQRETIVAWDKETGVPIYNAIVWQDSRTQEFCNNLKQEQKELIKNKTGLTVSSLFSASKINWILNNVEKAKVLLKQNKLLVGTIDSWLLFKLSSHKIHKTDHTNASRTMLFNINTLEWDNELLEIFNIPKEILPKVCYSSDFYCEINNSIIDPQSKLNTPICAISGDQQASLFGQQCFNKGETKATFGTGCFILMNIGDKKINIDKRLITTLCCSIKNEKINFAIEGSVFNAGTVIEWLANDLKILYHPEESDWYANLANINDEHNLYFIPAFTGLGAPYWDQEATGMIIGIKRSTRREHIIKSALEGICYQLKDVVETMTYKNELNLNNIKVDGGLSNCNYMNQFLANILNTKVFQTINSESTSLGVAYLCALNLGIINKKNLKSNNLNSFNNLFDLEEINNKYNGWKKAINKVLKWNE